LKKNGFDDDVIEDAINICKKIKEKKLVFFDEEKNNSNNILIDQKENINKKNKKVKTKKVKSKNTAEIRSDVGANDSIH
jgi:galactokinase/mevalonate kinase-like predicted kinase